MGKITKLYHSELNENVVLTTEEEGGKVSILVSDKDTPLVQMIFDEEQVVNLIYDLQDMLPPGTII